MDEHEVVRRDPAPALREHVGSYYGFREETARPLRRREGPAGEVVLILSFGLEWWIGDGRDPERPGVVHTSFVGGLHDAQVLTEHAGRSHGMQVNLAPQAAYVLFGLPMHSLAGRTVALDELLGRAGDRLVERLSGAGTWEARFDLLDTFLAPRLREAAAPSPGVAWAYRRLRDTHGRARVGALAEELGWSRKRLVARFREQVGLSPKTLARVLRFERAVELAGAGWMSWTEIALECGYFDQAHLVHDFRCFSGTTPGEYAAGLAAEGTFFQDAVPARS